jgi:hypothetical protein
MINTQQEFLSPCSQETFVGGAHTTVAVYSEIFSGTA